MGDIKSQIVFVDIGLYWSDIQSYVNSSGIMILMWPQNRDDIP